MITTGNVVNVEKKDNTPEVPNVENFQNIDMKIVENSDVNNKIFINTSE